MSAMYDIVCAAERTKYLLWYLTGNFSYESVTFVAILRKPQMIRRPAFGTIRMWFPHLMLQREGIQDKLMLSLVFHTSLGQKPILSKVAHLRSYLGGTYTLLGPNSLPTH